MSAPSTEYDLIFAGGGAAACLIAGRLSTADPLLKILVLEAGLHTKDLPAHTQPARYFSHLAPTSKTVTFNVGNAAREIGGRQLIIPSGRCVGGGSSVNFTMYSRAMASDFDDWKTVHGNAGWSYKDLLPLLKKTETYQVGDDKPTHGYLGPLKVSHGGAYTNIGKQFLEVAAAYDKERGSTDDINSMLADTSINKYGRWEKWIDAESGRRSDVPHHFIYNQDHQNLIILDGKRVKRVLFEGTRAVGVEYTNDIISRPNSDQTLVTAKAAKLVVVSAGAFGSPTILERSGIGAKKTLEEAGVKQLVDLPGVGENYQDHNVVFVPYLADDEAETLDALFRGEKEEIDKCVTAWAQEGSGLMAHNGLDAGVKLRPTAQELEELGTQFKQQWTEYFANAPDKPVIWIGPVSAYLGDPSVATARKYYSVGYYTQYPASRGSVHIKSGGDLHAPPDFNPGFLRSEADVATLRWGYKKSRELARRMGVYRGEFTPGNPIFPASSGAACKESTGPVDISAPDITYTDEDEKALETYNRKFVQTAWHSLGTCSMRQREKGGVVNERLDVYGVQGLKVADISIAPSNVAANTYSTAVTIGEKAATIIAEELGIAGV
ncbi:alcohol oxidase [Piloderma croceum F 1598]|uniref:Alcohol oxidase n=1 Tax=Piloderma croceum (strain F 1598) TaxID=765440 RepID=A0A0C3FIW7_PILCF|nr:alcohol oxidase [Piloderma croceum F 1598]